ncbi:Protein BIG GRAIN 1-like E [Linum grandiflorum]
MSTTKASKLFKKPVHHRTNSDELSVFEASHYFSSYNDDNPSTKTKVLPSRASSGSAGRMSLDLPMSNHGSIEPFDRNQILKEKGHIGNYNSSSNSTKQHKQPSSPGGRLASFLNTLFHQASRKNKKSKSKSLTANDEDHEIPGGGFLRRKRRSSISHFTRSITDTRSWYSSNHVPVLVPTSSAGASTSTIACTPTKNGSYKNLRSLIAASDQNHKIFDLDGYSNGLPVYETTDVGSIARGGGGGGGSKSVSSSCGTI